MSISRDRRLLPALTLTATALAGGLLAPAAQAAPAPAVAAPVTVAKTAPSVMSAPVAKTVPAVKSAATVKTMTPTASAVQSRINGVMRTASSLKGRPYRYGAVGPRAFDCSGYIKYVYNRNGVSVPRTANAQYRASRKISKSQARPGDLVFFGGSNKHHVGIYAGKGMMWHSPRSGKSVRLVKIWTSNWSAGRVIG